MAKLEDLKYGKAMMVESDFYGQQIVRLLHSTEEGVVVYLGTSLIQGYLEKATIPMEDLRNLTDEELEAIKKAGEEQTKAQASKSTIIK